MPKPYDPLAEDYGTQGVANDGAHENYDQFSNFLDPDVSRYVNDQMGQNHVVSDVENAPGWLTFLRGKLNQAPRSNPYSLNIGNQARGAYADALEQLHNGTSAIGSQANQAQGRLGSTVSAATARQGGLGQAMASAAGAQGAADAAGQAGAARLAEFMQQQQQYGSGLANMRSQDLAQMSAANKAGIQARAQDDTLHNFYADQGVKLQASRADLLSKYAQLREQLKVAKDKKNWDAVRAIGEGIATLVKLIASA